MEPHYRINIFYSESDRAYVAEIPELKGCWAFGHSPEEALDEVLIAQELWLQARARRGSPIPKPKRRAARQLGLATAGLLCKADPEEQVGTDGV
jgi:predicted RNase H-like HicB family nuclease